MATRRSLRPAGPPLSWAQNFVNLLFSARFRVEGDSMSPTLEHGQSVLVVRPVFSWNYLQRGDVVVLLRPGLPEGIYIKRIVALPDEEVKMAGGRVYADDVLLPEEYLVAPPLGYPGVNSEPQQTWWNGPEEVFVLGDNRQNSDDSRTFGPVPFDQIIARVWIRCWPLRELGLVR